VDLASSQPDILSNAQRRAFEMGQIRDNFRQTQPCNGRMALPARQIERSIPRLTVNKI
jgi:hypothetical protein